MDLNAVVVFAKVVQTGGFARAAKLLHLPKSTISRRVADLEQQLGVRLLQRSTRKLSLTDAGRTYYQHCERIVMELEQAAGAVTRMQQAPRGLLRVTAPLSFNYLAPIVAQFLSLYPEVDVEMVCTDRIVNLIEEGIDLAIRTGKLTDSSLVARALGSTYRVAVAADSYLARRGEPRTPAELEQHDGVIFGADPERFKWTLQNGSTLVQTVIRPRLVVNDLDMVREAAVHGLGIAWLTVDRCEPELQAGRLRRVLPDWQSREIPIHAVYPSTRQLAPKVSAFVEFLRTHKAPAPWQDEAAQLVGAADD